MSAAMSAAPIHWVSLDRAEPQFRSELGSVQVVDAGNLAILRGLSIKRVTLAPHAVREPQWNVNCNQLAYLTSGQVLVTLLADGNEFASFVVNEGQMYHVPSGAVYHVENIGPQAAELIFALRHERPQHFSLRDSLSAMTNAVLGNTYDAPAAAFDAFGREPAEQIVRRSGTHEVAPTERHPNAHLFDAEGQHPPLSYSYGSAHLARKQYWAALDDISMYSLRIKENGMRAPHWHPSTAEMGYVARGRARMRILDPDLSLDEYELSAGDVYFVPRAYPHHIEVLGEDEFHFLIFFDQPMPGDIGYRATATAFSREILACTFDVPERQLPQFPFTPADPLIVPRINPVDPVRPNTAT